MAFFRQLLAVPTICFGKCSADKGDPSILTVTYHKLVFNRNKLPCIITVNDRYVMTSWMFESEAQTSISWYFLKLPWVTPNMALLPNYQRLA